MSSSQLTSIPSQKRIPLATGREVFLCSDAVRMIPKQIWTIPPKMWMVWGRKRDRDPDPAPNPIAVRCIPPQSHVTVPGRPAPVPMSLHPARGNLQQDNPCRSPIPAGPQEGHVSPPTPWDEPSGRLEFGMTSWQVPGSLRPAGPPGDPWPGSPP